MEPQIPDFSPAPWCLNGHLHTMLPSLVFDSPALGSQKIIIPTPDDDFIEADFVDKGAQRPVVVLFHGLEGNSRRFYITRLAQTLINRKFSVLAVNFRSCGQKMNRQKRFYHSGETEDPITVLKWISEHLPGGMVFAAGFSLGASVLLNLLKKEATNHNVRAAAVISTPFFLKQGSLNLDKGFNRFYSLRFLRTLKEKARLKQKTFPDIPDFTGSTMFAFDDQITGPIHGFSGADDYYERCSSGFFMDQIQTDTLIIHSKDDPICPFHCVPEKRIRGNPKLIEVFTQKGGHVGFWSLPPGWLNSRVAEYFEDFL